MLLFLLLTAISLPDSLLKYPYVIIDEISSVELISPSSNIRKHYIKIQINSEKGKHRANFVESYNKFSKITRFEGIVVDAKGEKLQRFKIKDAYDSSEVDGSSLFSDLRSKRISVEQCEYPYIIEFWVEEKISGSLWLPALWITSGGEGFLIKESLQVSTKDSTLFTYHNINTDLKPIRQSNVWEWTIENISPSKPLFFGRPLNERLPRVQLVPVKFSMQKFDGSLTSWNEFGKWFDLLNKGMETLPSDETERIIQLTQGLKTHHEKIDRIYADLKSSTRYLALNLGIGGFQSIPASTICKTKYGDCKGLTTYMKGMLAAAGIASNYIFINRDDDEDDILTNVPSHQFNHVILGVPTEKDTVWLECTSQTYPTGYLDRSTAGRHALWIEESGGKLVKVPNLTKDQNAQIRSASVIIQTNGSLTADVKEIRSGFQHEDFRYFARETDPKRRTTFIRNQIQSGSANVSNINIVVDEKKPVSTTTYAMNSGTMVNKAGKMLFLKASLFEQITTKAEKDSLRTEPVRFNQAFSDVDTLLYTLPEGYAVSSFPKDAFVTGPAESYARTISVEGSKLRVTRKRERHATRLPASTYNDHIAYLKTVSAHDAESIILKKD